MGGVKLSIFSIFFSVEESLPSEARKASVRTSFKPVGQASAKLERFLREGNEKFQKIKCAYFFGKIGGKGKFKHI